MNNPLPNTGQQQVLTGAEPAKNQREIRPALAPTFAVFGPIDVVFLVFFVMCLRDLRAAVRRNPVATVEEHALQHH